MDVVQDVLFGHVIVYCLANRVIETEIGVVSCKRSENLIAEESANRLELVCNPAFVSKVFFDEVNVLFASGFRDPALSQVLPNVIQLGYIISHRRKEHFVVQQQ